MPLAAQRPQRLKFSGVVVVLVTCVAVTSVYSADEYQIGQSAHEAGDYEQTFRVWLPIATAGDVRAQFGLGTLFFEGHGVELDLEQSVQWFRQAAEQGFAPAQFNLGNAYKHGRGVRQDDRLANAWWLKAAEQQFAPAQFNLGTQYYFGRGVEQSESEALRWYRLAADNGHPRARALFESEGSAGATTESDNSGGTALEWIYKEPPEHFTVQLLATRNATSAHVLRAKPGLAESRKTAVVEFLREGVSWYAVVYGVFATRAQAQDAIGALPAELRETTPWIRRIGDVKNIAISVH